MSSNNYSTELIEELSTLSIVSDTETNGVQFRVAGELRFIRCASRKVLRVTLLD